MLLHLAPSPVTRRQWAIAVRYAAGTQVAKDGRQHVHSRIDAAELPVTHVTRRQGRPYTLVLKKTDALFAREQEARSRDETDLEWLAAEWNRGA